MISEKNQSHTSDGIITSIRNYTYGNNKHLYPTKIATRNGNKDIKIETFVYPQDIVSPNVAEKNLVNTNRLNSLLKSNVSYGGRTWSEKTDYELKGGNARPVAMWSGISGEEEKRIKILNYDIYGNPLFITVDDADNVVYLWSYSGKYIIAEIKNATYTEVSNALVGTTPEQLSTSTVPDMSKVDALRTALPKAHVTTYNYKSLVGMVRKTDPNDVVTYYEHDSFDRLKLIKDYHQKIMKQHSYHYKP